jgi:ATP-dependent RNA helicase HelY
MVLWSPFVTFDQVAALAASTSFRLLSAFRPTYNMAANLVRSYTPEVAHHLLNLSFAQFQADRDVVKLETRRERRAKQLEALRSAAESPFGDVNAYRASLDVPADHPRRREVEASLDSLRPGDIISIAKGSYHGRAAVLSTAHRKGAVRLSVLTTSGNRLQLTAADFDDVPVSRGRIRFPVPFAPNRADFQRAVARNLRKAALKPVQAPKGDASPTSAGAERHPVEADPDLGERLKAAVQAERVEREVQDLTRRVTSRTQSVARTFDVVLEMLQRWGYVDGWSLTGAGQILARLFHESDLLIAEALREGLFDDLDMADLAGLASVFVYEHRSPEPPAPPWFPTAGVARRFKRIVSVSAALRAEEERAGLPPHRGPDPGFVGIAVAWARGERFSTVVEDEEITGGDFVRTIRQLIDLLEQFSEVAPNARTRAAAAQACDALFRGVISASSRLPDDERAADE